MSAVPVDHETSWRGGDLILALDEGTTNTKALLVDVETGVVVAGRSRGLRVAFPAPHQVEQDAEEIWAATCDAVEEVMAAVPRPRVVGVSISNQRETVVAWDARTGEVLGPALGWQDARQSAWCDQLAAGERGWVRERTGLDLDPMFSAPKMRWLLDANRGRDVRVGTIDTFLVHRLTGAFVAEAGNASRTLLMDLATQDWDDELLDLFGVPRGALAPIRRSDAVGATTRSGLPVPAGVPIASALADSHAALYLHGQGRPGEGKATYGTGSSVMVPVEQATTPVGVARTLAWATGRPVFAFEGNVLATGAALGWMAGILAGGDVAVLGELAAQSTRTDVVLVPAFSGLGAPYFDRDAVGLIAGLDGATSPADLARAAFDAVAHQVADVVEAIESDQGVSLDALHADGGATVSALLMKRQADLLGRGVHIAATAESSALGAALLAAQALSGPDVAVRWAAHRPHGSVVQPTLEPADRATQRAVWHDAVARSRGAPPPGDARRPLR